MAPKFEFKRAKNFENRGQGGGYPIGLWDQKWTKFRSWMLLWLLSCLGGVLESLKKFWEAFWDSLERLLGPNLGPKMEPTWLKNRSKNRSFFGCLLESIFSWILMDFGSQNGAKLAPKWDQTSISQKTQKNAFGASPLVPNWVQGLEVGGKNRSKIDQKMKSKREGVLGSIFHRFWWVWEAKLGGQTEPGGRQNAT